MSNYKIKIGQPNKNFNSNYISKTPYSFFYVPFYTIKSYFLHSYENMYFLILSLLQLSTCEYINLLPREWSPTGPFSTLTPLMLCFIMELLSNFFSWIIIKKNEIIQNYKLVPVYRNKKWKKIYSKNLFPGDIFKVIPNKEILVDSLLLYSNEEHSKISLSTLTGEPDLVPVKNLTSESKLNEILNNSLNIVNFFPKNLDKLSANLDNIQIDEKYFIPGGGINCDHTMYCLAISCGVNKKCYHQSKKSNLKKNNIFDRQNAEYMMKVNTKILIIKMFIITICSLVYDNKTNYFEYLNLYNVIQKIIQSWILFNGVIPFSIKIITVLVRYFQSKTRGIISVNNTNSIDQFAYIDKIISDKTGTLTKNEMNFSKIVFPNNNIIDLEYGNLKKEDISNNLYLFQCLGVCIHFHNEKYSTIEDEVIRKRYYYLGCKIYQTSDSLELILPDGTTFNYKLFNIKQLEFSSSRKRSSIIVKNLNTNNYVIFSKGSINTIKTLVEDNDIEIIENNDMIVINNFPELRVMACCYKELNKSEVEIILDKLCINDIGKKELNFLEKNMKYLGIIGLKDALQEGIYDTVNFLYLNKKPICVCTGDRKETAIAISKECGIIYKNEFELDYKFILYNIDKSKTLIFSGNFLSNVIMTSYEHMIKFIDLLSNNPNFIAYSLLPEHKKYLVNILESQNINILSIGDGNNDIPMLKNSTMGIGINNGNNYQVTEATDINIRKFKHLKNLFTYSNHCLSKNLECSEFILFKTTFLSFSIFFNIFYNSFEFDNPIIQGVELQGFHLFWATFPILFYTCLVSNNFKREICNIKQLNYRYFKWMLSGVISSWSVIYFSNNYIARWYKLFLLVFILNGTTISKINKVFYKKFYILLHIIGLLFLFIYIFFYYKITYSLEMLKNTLLVIFFNIISFLFITNS